MKLVEGQLIHRRYRLDSRLAQGGMGEVWKGYDIQLGRPVAIKALRGDLGVTQEAKLLRLRAEAHNSANLAHPNIAALFEYYEHDGIGFLIMEYVPSKSLADLYHEQNGPMDPIKLLPILVQTARGLFVAHSHGVIHRDVKPANIMVSDSGEVKITDFGVSYSTNQEQITQDGMVVGTAQYISPEQAQGKHATPQSDIYSLGATLFAMLIGQSPYEYFYADVLGDSQRQVRAERLKSVILNNPLPKLNRPDVPAEVERVLRKALSRTPEDRYYSALEFARDMQRVQQALYGRAVQTTVEGVPDYPQNMYAQTSAFDQSAPVAKQHARWAKPLAVTVAAAAAVVVMALAFVTVVMPNMDASSDNSKVQVQNHGAQNHAEDDPDSAITSGSVPSVQDLTGEYTADGKVRFTWVNPSPKDGDSYAWSLVGDSGTDPNAQGTTTESTSIEIDPADGAQTCVQVSLVRADRQMSENPMIACAAKP